jgi:hypothetical protein
MCLLPAGDVDAVLGQHWAHPRAVKDREQTVNSARCSAVLEELERTICSKRRGMLTNEVVLHHDTKTENRSSPPPTTFADRSKMRYVDADLQTMKKFRTRCIRGFMRNQKPSRMTSGSLWTEVTCVEKLGDYTEN